MTLNPNQAQISKHRRERERLERVGCLKKPSARWNKQDAVEALILVSLSCKNRREMF